MEPTVVLRAPVVIDDNGPLTKAYFNELSSFIGDEWQVLADKLGIKKARMQVSLYAVISSYALLNG